jgi:hypothetical protein
MGEEPGTSGTAVTETQDPQLWRQPRHFWPAYWLDG